MIVLDTNIVSEVSKLRPDRGVVDWLRAADRSDLYLCVPVVAELAVGGERTRIRSGSDRYLAGLTDMLNKAYQGRILPFETDAALVFGKLQAAREAAGRPLSVMDGMIAAICHVHDAVLATRNIRDFENLGIELVNPFSSETPD